MREFKNPYYEGKECPCCPNKQELYSQLAWALGFDMGEEFGAKKENERIIDLIKEKLQYVDYEGIGDDKKIFKIDTLVDFLLRKEKNEH